MRQLREARRWLTLQQFLEYAVWSFAVGLGVLVISRMGPPLPQASFPPMATHVRWLDRNCLCGGTLAVAIGASRCQRTGRASTHQGSLSHRTRLADKRRERALRRRTPGDLCVCSEIAGRRLLASETALAKCLWLLMPLAAFGLCRGIEGMARWAACSRACQRPPIIGASARGGGASGGNRQGV